MSSGRAAAASRSVYALLTWHEEETRRRAAMAPYVLSEHDGFYRGRELIVPAQPLT